MIQHIKSPSIIDAAGTGGKIIEEFFGRVNSNTSEVSIARMTSPKGWVEPGQSPDFNEYKIIPMIPMIIASSLLFALLHSGIGSIPFQGVAGVLLCITYLKCGGGENKHIKGLLSSSTMHFCYNCIVAIYMLCHGVTMF